MNYPGDPVAGPIAEWLTGHGRADAVAIVDGIRALTHRQLAEQADATAAALVAAGYGHGSRIATVTRNSADHVALFFACARIGAALVPLSWRLTPTELHGQLATADPDLVLTTDEFADRVPAGRLGSLALPRATESHPAGKPRPNDSLLLVFTSGTAGTPRAAMITYANTAATARSLHGVLSLDATDTVLALLPQFHVAAWNTQPLLALAVGARVVVEPTFIAERALELVERERVTALMGVPTMWQAMARHPRFGSTDLSSLRYAVVGGAAASDELLAAWHGRGVALRQGYGLTEASPNVLCQSADAALAHPGWCGTAYPGVETALVDTTTGELCAGSGSGELLVRGAGVFAGYFRDPEATAAVLRDHGSIGTWLHTGDVAERDAQGQYRLIDRLKDIFVSGGENVAPAEIEAALLSHPGVAAAAVAGVEDPVWGEVGHAWVVAGVPAPTETALREHLMVRLAGFKIPRDIVFVPELPQSGVGKVLRRRLSPQRQEAP